MAPTPEDVAVCTVQAAGVAAQSEVVCYFSQAIKSLRRELMKESVMKRSRVLILVAVAGVYAGLTGCATTGDLDALKAEVSQNKADIATANKNAADAKAMAQEAMSTANQANSTAEDTASKLDRMFKKSMYK
jgi:murein lipoprotein